MVARMVLTSWVCRQDSRRETSLVLRACVRTVPSEAPEGGCIWLPCARVREEGSSNAPATSMGSEALALTRSPKLGSPVSSVSSGMGASSIEISSPLDCASSCSSTLSSSDSSSASLLESLDISTTSLTPFSLDLMAFPPPDTTVLESSKFPLPTIFADWLALGWASFWGAFRFVDMLEFLRCEIWGDCSGVIRNGSTHRKYTDSH